MYGMPFIFQHGMLVIFLGCTVVVAAGKAENK